MSFADRIANVFLAVAVSAAWLYFAPDFSVLSSRPLGNLTLAELMLPIAWLLCLVPVGYLVLSFLYQAIAGRDCVWFWHPD